MTALDQRDEVREHQRRRIRGLENQVEGLVTHRAKLESVLAVLAVVAARGDAKVAVSLVDAAEAIVDAQAGVLDENAIAS